MALPDSENPSAPLWGPNPMQSAKLTPFGHEPRKFCGREAGGLLNRQPTREKRLQLVAQTCAAGAEANLTESFRPPAAIEEACANVKNELQPCPRIDITVVSPRLPVCILEELLVARERINIQRLEEVCETSWHWHQPDVQGSSFGSHRVSYMTRTSVQQQDGLKPWEVSQGSSEQLQDLTHAACTVPAGLPTEKVHRIRLTGGY